MVVPEIIAAVELFPKAAGGRTSPMLAPEWRGILGIDGVHYSCRFAVAAGTVVAPGDTIEVGVQFLFPELALPHFTVGKHFTVWEGRDIGSGTVSRFLRAA